MRVLELTSIVSWKPYGPCITKEFPEVFTETMLPVKSVIWPRSSEAETAITSTSGVTAIVPLVMIRLPLPSMASDWRRSKSMCKPARPLLPTTSGAPAGNATVTVGLLKVPVAVPIEGGMVVRST